MAAMEKSIGPSDAAEWPNHFWTHQDLPGRAKKQNPKVAKHFSMQAGSHFRDDRRTLKSRLLRVISVVKDMEQHGVLSVFAYAPLLALYTLAEDFAASEALKMRMQKLGVRPAQKLLKLEAEACFRIGRHDLAHTVRRRAQELGIAGKSFQHCFEKFANMQYEKNGQIDDEGDEGDELRTFHSSTSEESDDFHGVDCENLPFAVADLEAPLAGTMEMVNCPARYVQLAGGGADSYQGQNNISIYDEVCNHLHRGTCQESLTNDMGWQTDRTGIMKQLMLPGMQAAKIMEIAPRTWDSVLDGCDADFGLILQQQLGAHAQQGLAGPRCRDAFEPNPDELPIPTFLQCRLKF